MTFGGGKFTFGCEWSYITRLLTYLMQRIPFNDAVIHQYLNKNAGFQSSWGKLYKYFPIKLWFLIGMFIFEVGSLICGVAQNPTTLIVGRAIAGVGGGGITVGMFTIIGLIAAPEKRAQLLGLAGATYGVSAVLGPLIGGAFTDKVTWRWVRRPINLGCSHVEYVR